MRLRHALLALCLFAPSAAWADARAGLHAAFVKFLAQTSFEGRTSANVNGRAIESVVEFQAPDRYRVTAAGRPPSVIIGSTMYLAINGRTVKVPMAAGSIEQFRDPARLKQVEASATVDDLGLDAVGGVPARKYRYHVTTPTVTECVVWVGVASGLPLKLHATTRGKTPIASDVTYGRYGDPTIKVSAP